MKFLVALLVSALAPVSVQAANNVALDNSVFVERTSVDTTGKTRVLLEQPKVVVPGDKLVFVLAYRNQGTAPAKSFVITNPMPSAVAFQGDADRTAVVSVDGGKSWGALAQLKARNADGSLRAAQSDDVTHVRWAFAQPIPVGGSGKLMFRGVVK